MPGLTLGGQGWDVPANCQRARSERSPPGRARCLLEPFPDSQGRAIINAVYGFCQFSRRKLEGPSPTRTVRQGSSLALPRAASTGTSARPLRDAAFPGLSPAPPAATSMRCTTPCWRTGRRHRQHRYRQGGENRKPHGRIGPERLGPIHPERTGHSAHPSLSGWNGHRRPRPLPHACDVAVQQQQRRGFPSRSGITSAPDR